MKFRSELFAGEEYRDAAKVMAFETFELGNDDILDTLSATILSGNPIVKEFEAIKAEQGENGCVDDMSEEDRIGFFNRVLDAIAVETGKHIKYVLWLADRANAYRYALSGDNIRMMEKTFTESDIPVDFEGLDAYDESAGIVLSDIGEDGCLYGFETYPMPIKNN